MAGPSRTVQHIVISSCTTACPTEVGLGHELIHARHILNGLVNFAKPKGVKDPDHPNRPSGQLTNEELAARKEENKLRKEQGVTLRAKPEVIEDE